MLDLNKTEVLAASPVEQHEAAPALSRQDIFDKFSFLEGLVSQSTYVSIAETAVAIYENASKAAQPEQPAADERAATPSAKWRVDGEPDPHGTRYDCERAALTLGTLTDDELANAVFMHGNERPPIQDVIAGTAFMPIVYLTAAKERIRWLSRALETARASSPNAAGAEGSHVQCCDTPSFCSSVRRCTAQDVAPVQESSSCDHQWTWADGKCADCGANVQQPTQTTGMTLVERIEHVGGRLTEEGCIEFGSAMAVDALIQHVLRDARASSPNAAGAEDDANRGPCICQEDLGHPEGTCIWKSGRAPCAAPAQAAGHCRQGDNCVCGGDLARVREGCSEWVKQ